MFRYKDKVSYFRWQTIIWSIFVLVFGVIWLSLWLGSDDKSGHTALKSKTQQAQMVKMPQKIEKLDELFVEVAPVKFETITRDLRSYPPEFKDKKYFEQHKKKFAVQVMNVAEHKIIVDYLDSRKDRDKFAYFRYTDSNKETRYVLTYGVFSSFVEAMGATKTIIFGLPNSVRPVPEEFNRYIAMIDDYERMTMAVDGDKGLREIKLTKAQYEIPVAPRTPPSAPKENKEKKTSTTRTDKPTAKNTVSLEEPKPKKSEKKKEPIQEFNERKAKAEAEARKKSEEAKKSDKKDKD